MRTISTEIAARSHRVELENPGDPVPDGEGGFTESWAPLTPPWMWASIAPASTADLEQVIGDSAVQAIATHVIGMLFHPGVTIETRATWRRAPKRPDRFFQVQGVQVVDEREITLVLVCSELVGATAPPQREEGATDGGAGVGPDGGTDGTTGGTAPPPAGIND